MLRTFIQVTALFQVAGSSFFLIKGLVGLSVTDIVELSQMRCGYHLGVARNLAGQRADTTIGSVLLLLSLILQTGNLLWEMRIDDFGVSSGGVVLALIVSLVIFFGGYRLSRYLQAKWHKQAEDILTKRNLRDI